MGRKRRRNKRQWYAMDLHLHTPASNDYQDMDASFLDILKRAEMRRLDMIAFTDHNTVAGYRRMQEEIRQYELLEQLNRLLPDEKAQLSEYRRLTEKILVLPGFEFTATLGFHILAIFSPEKSIREIEHLLLNLNIAPEKLELGSATVGATVDVLTAYELINDAGGLVIAAHANSSNGVAMRGFSFGGQTKISYTQDPNLHALEVTDLGKKGRHSTAAFFNGTKPEYPRRMHCIQGSDAHRLVMDLQRKKNLGIGDRATEALLTDISFQALKDLFASNDFARTRPRYQTAEPVYDFIREAQDEGVNIVQDFHETMTVRGGKLYGIIADVCAFANSNGGSVFVGIDSDPRKPVPGIAKPANAIERLEQEISNRISPALQCSLDIHTVSEKKVVRILVPRGDDPPYAVDENKIYVRSEAETGLAVRDEIVSLVKRGGQGELTKTGDMVVAPKQIDLRAEEPLSEPSHPRTGVEVVEVEERKGVKYYTLRDLRNGDVVKNVTRSSARRLWRYAINAFDRIGSDIQKSGQVQWQGALGLVRHQTQGKLDRYDLVQQTADGYRYYFGVTEDGIHDEWKVVVGAVED